MAIDSIYSLNFDGAERLLNEAEATMPEYPGTHLLRVYFLVWKNRPVLEQDSTFEAFLKTTDKVLATTKLMLEEDENNEEAIFYAISIHAILARIFVDSGHNWKAIMQAK